MAFRQRFIQTKFFRALVAAVFIILGLLFQPRFLFEPLRSLIATISWPVQGVLSLFAFELRDSWRFVTSIGELKHENDRLSQENVRLVAENAKWQFVAQENEELHKELGVLPRSTFHLQPAEVIGRDAAGLGNWLTIDQGTLQGVARGMPVIVYESILVGRVTEVFPESARVMLLTNPESMVSGVTVEGAAQGIVRGEYGLGTLFDMVSQDASLSSADRLVTSGLGGEFPKNLLVGTLQEVHPSADHLYQQTSVISPIDSTALRYVFVIKDSLRP